MTATLLYTFEKTEEPHVFRYLDGAAGFRVSRPLICPEASQEYCKRSQQWETLAWRGGLSDSMKKLTFYSWEVCPRQEAFTLLLCRLGGLGVAKARRLVQHVLARQPETLELPDRVAGELRSEAEAIGIECGYE